MLEFLETFKQPVDIKDREILRCVARTSLRTKLAEKLADQLTDIIVDAVMMIHKEGTPLDLHMVGGCAWEACSHVCMGHMHACLFWGSTYKEGMSRVCTWRAKPQACMHGVRWARSCEDHCLGLRVVGRYNAVMHMCQNACMTRAGICMHQRAMGMRTACPHLPWSSPCMCTNLLS